MQRVQVWYSVNGTVKVATFRSDRIAVQIESGTRTGSITLYVEDKETQFEIYSDVHIIKRWTE